MEDTSFWDHYSFSKALIIPDSDAWRCEREKIDAVFDITPATHPKILDVGCGVGKYAIHFLQNGHSVTGTDVSRGALQVLKERAKHYAVEKKLNLVEFDFYSPKFENEFDAAHMISMLENVPARFHEILFTNVVKAVRPEGKIFVFEANIKNPFMFVGQLLGGIQPLAESLTLFKLQRRDILALMKKNKLANVRIIPYGFFPTRFVNYWTPFKRVNEFLCSLPVLNRFCLFYLYTGVKK